METKRDLVDSLKSAADEAGLAHEKISLAIACDLDQEELDKSGDREEIIISDGKNAGVWRVESLRELFRGNRKPLSDAEMEHYPTLYVPFFHRVENGVYFYCSNMDIWPTDDEFLKLYTQMRRRPEGKSMGPVHDVIWQSAALALGLNPWSEAEFTAIFGQLARSVRHFRKDSCSRNYCEHILLPLGGEG